MFSTRKPGWWMTISAGASAPGVNSKMHSMPSITCRSTGCSITTVGAISVTVPVEVVLPRPASTWPRTPLGSKGPN